MTDIIICIGIGCFVLGIVAGMIISNRIYEVKP